METETLGREQDPSLSNISPVCAKDSVDIPAPTTSTRKRKPAENVQEIISPFKIHPFQTTSLSSSISSIMSVTPIKAVLREHIPIKLLKNALTISKTKKLFSASQMTHPRPVWIKIPGFTADKVLFAKIEEENILVAIESIGVNLYMISPLHDSIKIKHIKDLWKRSKLFVSTKRARYDVNLESTKTTDLQHQQIQKTIINLPNLWNPLPVSQINIACDLNITDRLDSFDMTPPVIRSTDLSQRKIDVISTTVHGTPGITTILPKNSSIQELLKYVQSLYFEALYLSKSPLTFFAKGTLARFRVLCSDVPSKISEILGQMILTVGETDFKYKTGLASFLSEMETLHGQDEVAIGIFNPDNPAIDIPVSENLSRSIKGLNFFDRERTYIQRLWNSDENVRSANTRGPKLEDIKKRETKLQIILVLELLSQQQRVIDDKTKDQKIQKKSKKDGLLPNLGLLLNVLFDRLYIWQTMSSIDIIIGKRDLQDEVREFCLEVVSPFYGSRLPKETEKLLGKCGIKSKSVDSKKSIPSRDQNSFDKYNLLSPTNTLRFNDDILSQEMSPLATKQPRKLAGRSLSQASTTETESKFSYTNSAKPESLRSGRKLSAIRGGLMIDNKALERREVSITSTKKR
ncbi:DNA replication regulator SLD3-domain-containing protein [Dipodascopsis uninucleata]